MDRPPGWARGFVAAFLGVFLFFGASGSEWWPLTGWKLFSRMRTEYQNGWLVRSVHHSRPVERGIDFTELPRGFRGAQHVLEDFPTLSRRERQSVCHAWVIAVRRDAPDVLGVRIYRTRTRVGREPMLVTRRLVEGCRA